MSFYIFSSSRCYHEKVWKSEQEDGLCLEEGPVLALSYHISLTISFPI